MKHLLWLAVALAWAAYPFFAQAQQANAKDPKAEEILNAMSDKYKKMGAFRADFSCNIKSPQEKLNETFNGQITVKGEKYRLKLPEQEIFNNQSTVWTYIKEDNEVTITENDPSGDDVNPAEVYNMYKKGFKYVWVEDKKEGTDMVEVIDLTPDDKSVNYFKIRLTVNKKTKDLKSWQIFEKNGRRFLYTITKFEPSVAVNDAFFNFDKSKYPNVKEVDLR